MKLWEAFKAFENNEVIEYKGDNDGDHWSTFNKYTEFCISVVIKRGYTFRLKPKPFERWVIIYDDGYVGGYFKTKEEAEEEGELVSGLRRRVIHMREVKDET